MIKSGCVVLSLLFLLTNPALILAAELACKAVKYVLLQVTVLVSASYARLTRTKVISEKLLQKGIILRKLSCRGIVVRELL